VKAAAENVLRSFGAPQGKTLMRKTISGAGHESLFISKRCPTAMIFVPCIVLVIIRKNGVRRRNVQRASVLMEDMLRYDRSRKGAEI
jgi:hypothetical protein